MRGSARNNEKMVAIIDYDAGNIKSVEKAFQFLGKDVCVTRNPKDIYQADHVVLPGVGSYGDAMCKLKEYDLADVIREVTIKEIPFLGICLGMQLLFDCSEESNGVCGLGILRGEILRIPTEGGHKVPQIGWNSLQYPHEGRLFKNISENSYVYFVHSYYLHAADPQIVKATTEYGVCIDASIEAGNIFACQFHPEKSSEVGMQILTNFLEV